MLRISISGPPRSGKTTLISHILSQLPEGSQLVTDLPREAFNTLNASLLTKDELAFQHYVGFAQLLAEATAERNPGLCILDKSLIDAVTYWDVLVGGARPVWADELNRSRYRLVFLCDHNDIDSDPGLDRIASTHIEMRSLLAARIREVMTEIGVEPIVLRGDPTFRAKHFMEQVESIL